MEKMESNGAAAPEQNAAPPHKQTPHSDVTNELFVAAVFKNIPHGAAPIVCSKTGDPTEGGWSANPATTHAPRLTPGTNNYVNCSSIKPDEMGFYKAKKEQAAAYHFILLDDVGTKVPRKKLGGLKPTWALETSPGNYQVGIVLATPIGPLLTKRLLDAIIAKGLCDPGATGMTRWARLPVGINGKEKYRNESGSPFKCRLDVFAPERVFSTEQVIDLLDLEMGGVEDATSQASGRDHGKDSGSQHKGTLSIGQLASLVNALDPNMGRADWIRVLMSVWYETNGSDEGFELVDSWSKQGKTYGGREAMLVQWRSFGKTANPVSVGTLIFMARQAGVDTTPILKGTKDFQPRKTEVALATSELRSSTSSASPAKVANPFMRFAVTNDLEMLQRNLVEQVPVLGNVALMGQATVYYAQANTGKTLIKLHLINRAIAEGLIDPSKLYYINMDDNTSGLLEKSRLAQDLGYQMLADGYLGFRASAFRQGMQDMIDTDTAKGVVIVLDTLKKFVNTMSKDQASEFARLIRQFCLKGGTVIALAHANKKPDAEGNPIYAGTTDIVDDFDCAYTLKTVSQDADSKRKVVEYTNIKRRGDVASSASYSYAIEVASYSDLLLSVRVFDPQDLAALKQEAALKSEAPVIAAVEACVAAGINTKMQLAEAAAKNADCSKRNALAIIEKYTGTDIAVHRWKYEVKARGAKTFALLDVSQQGLPPDSPPPNIASVDAADSEPMPTAPF